MSIEKRNPRLRPVFKLGAPDDQEKFKPLPLATATYPYRLNAEDVIGNIPADNMVFHMAGDTGSLKLPAFQQLVAREMGRQYHELDSVANRPLFLFHLGDVVYNFGQAAEYYDQFFYPYKDYPGKIFAIPGNHDGDVDPTDPIKPQSLDAFRAVFCDTEARTITIAGESSRKSNIQPNVYWKMQTPLADIIGLYSNVPKFGTIQTEQKEWFIAELKASASNAERKAIILCIHHAPYSADINHGSSIHMQQFLNDTFAAAGVRPDIVFSGHVHNYQRFNKYYDDGLVLPFIVSGAGGYADLHPIAQPGDPMFPDESRLLDDVELQNYCDDAHGFLRITLQKENETMALKGEYFVIPHSTEPGATASLFDTFALTLK